MADTNLDPETNKVKQPTVLVVIDGFGVAPDGEGNAIVRAKTPNWDRFVKTYPAMTIRASGEEVGLSWGEMGNSEVGHLAIGALDRDRNVGAVRLAMGLRRR